MVKKKTIKNKRKKKIKSNSYTKYILIIVLILFLLLAVMQWGLIGSYLANILTILVGNLYVVLDVLIIIKLLAVLFNIKITKIRYKTWFNILCLLFGILLFDHLLLFNSLGYHSHYINVTWNLIYHNFINHSVGNNVGGGMVGAYLLSFSNRWFGYYGSFIAVILLILFGLGTKIQFLIKYLHDFFAKLIYLFDAFIKHHRKKNHDINLTKRSHDNSLIDKKIRSSKKVNYNDNSVKKSDSKDDNLDITIASDSDSSLKINNSHHDINKESETLFTPLDNVNSKLDDNYILPSINLLSDIKQIDQSDELHLIKENSKILQKTLSSFGVKAEIKHVSLGPSVTKYELHPDIGVKVSKIVNLSDDLALALAAKDIRIEAPIPGKSLIGIEVPNKNISTVSFKDVITNMKHSGNVLEFPLGRNVTGDVITCNLTKMPHLLIAGSTGSGKSVAINSIITSILMKAKPNQVKFVLIDPKKVELSIYNDIPHLLAPVVSDPRKAAKTLSKVVKEMENRYELFTNYGVRNIDGYNKQNEDEKLPYVVVIVDELADLMMTVSSEVEDSIIRIAQMGRAAGIHMILATQRPSVDVITGLIKANVPSRIAFAVSSGIDSRTILDNNGAEKLLGKGDMLYQPIGQNKPTRIQGDFIPDVDVKNIVDFITNQQKASYVDDMIIQDSDLDEDDNDEEVDQLFNDAVNFVREQKKASTSLLQRHFRIGYNRAARIIDAMESKNIIGPSEGSKPRKVYLDNKN